MVGPFFQIGISHPAMVDFHFWAIFAGLIFSVW
jgi:hypothetical protein